MNNKFDVRLSDSAKDEFKALDGSVKQVVAKQLKALEAYKEAFKNLGNKP